MKAFDSIAYSGLLLDKGSANTAEHYQYRATLPFTTIKGDVRPTKDGGVIMCHDPGFTLDADGRIVRFDKTNCRLILEMTTAECLSLEHAETFENKHCKVVCFEAFAHICKECGKSPFVTVRNERIDTLAPAIIEILSKHDLLEHCVINSFTHATLESFRSLCPTIRLSYVLPLRKVLEKSDVDVAVDFGNCILTTFHFTGKDAVSGYPIMDASADALAYAAIKGVKVYQAQVGSTIDLTIWFTAATPVPRCSFISSKSYEKDPFGFHSKGIFYQYSLRTLMSFRMGMR